MANAADRHDLIAAMVRHLPPSGARLRLLDVAGACADALRGLRPDVDALVVTGADWPAEPGSADAVTALDVALDADLLRRALLVLRPGGRFISVDSQGTTRPELVMTLENAGFTRILVEPALDSGGVLARGEKPHTEQCTVDRIAQTAARDDQAAGLDAYSGRFVHLLIRQTPNKPVWALRPGEPVEWAAAALVVDGGPALLAFSSLPKAVAFMQPAVLAGLVTGVNKVGKFSRATAQTWPQALLFNPDIAQAQGVSVIFIPIDPATAEAPDE